jgi:hypothetical protein
VPDGDEVLDPAIWTTVTDMITAPPILGIGFNAGTLGRKTFSDETRRSPTRR